MANFQKVKLGDIAQVIDCPHSTPKWVDSGIFAIRNFNLLNGKIVKEKNSYVDQETFIERTRRALPKKGDCILSREAPIGSIGYVNTDERICLGQRVVLIHPADNFDSRFLLYQLLSSDVQNQFMQSEGSGSTVSNLRIPLIKNTKISSTDPHTQKIIGSIIGAYDDLIENNEKRIKILEEMAQLLYIEWFIKFKFPGHEKIKMVESGTEYGKVPDGWEVKVLGDILENVRNSTHAGKHLSARQYIPIENISRKSLILRESSKWEDAQSSLVLFEKNDILFGAMRPYFHKVAFALYNGVTRTTCLVLRPRKDALSSFALMIVFSDDFVSYASSNSKGATIPYSVWDNSLENFKVLVPSTDILIKFEQLAKEAVLQMGVLANINKSLSKTRDLLIPQLVTGKREVK